MTKPFQFALLMLPVVTSACVSERDFQERTQKDNWFQAPNNQVDILWVVDDSCSMEEEQQTLANGFQTFVGQMEDSQTDFHIGVISTSVEYDDPNLGTMLGDPPYLTNLDDYVAEFTARTQMGITGSDKEKGLEAAARALHPSMTTIGGPNAGFLRPDAQLLVVIVSDEEDCSDEGALGDQPAEECYRQRDILVPVSEYVQEFRKLKARKDMVQFGAIVGVKQAACDDAYPGSRYIDMTKTTGGLVGDICLADWSNMLSELGLTATGIRTAFQTSFVAKTETLEITVNGEVMESDPVDGWTYDPDTCYLTFGPNAVPERDSDILAEYTIQSGLSCE